MNREIFRDTQEEMPKPDEQLGQEEQAVDFNPTTVVASHTRLITDAVQGLEMNPEEDAEVGLAENDNGFSGGTGSLSDDVVPRAVNNADSAITKIDPTLTQSKQQEKYIN